MIELKKLGKYRVVKTYDHKTLLYLDKQAYHWNYAPGIGNLLTFSKHPHKTKSVLKKGHYRIYDVKNEPRLVDLQHIEFCLNDHEWQGYLLLTGLPTEKKLRSRIETTNEVITGRANYRIYDLFR